MAGATVLALVARLGGQLVETAFYVIAWRSMARRLRFAPVFVAILTLSLCDAVAATLLRLVEPESARGWLVWLVGFRAMPGAFAEESGFRIAFGSLGLLALGRVLGTAHAQRREGAPWRGALALTLAATLASRLATWWITDSSFGA